MSKTCKWLAAAGVFVLTLAPYLRTREFAYLRLDDWGYTAGCPFAVSGLSLTNIAQAFSRITYGGIWMPLTFATYMADVTFFGGGWGVHHLGNAFLHALNASILFFALLHLARREEGDCNAVSAVLLAALATLFWSLHPMRVEAVAWIASRKEELWTLFTLLGLMAWSAQKKAIGFLCCVLACLSKPTAVCFPLLAFLVEMRTRPPQRRMAFLALAKYVPLCIVCGITGLAAIASQAHPEGMATIELGSIPLAVRFVRFVSALALHLSQTLLPCAVHFDYLANTFDATAIAGLALCAVLFAFAMWKKRTMTFYAATFFLVALLPVSGLFGTFGEHARADRFTYLPAMAISALLAVALPRRKSAIAAMAVACAACAAIAWPVVSSYRNDYTAFARTLEFEPENWRALRHVGSEYCARLSRMDEGIAMLEKSYAISPRSETLEVLAYSLACRMAPNDARRIARLCPDYSANPSLDRRGMILESLGAAALAAGEYKAAAMLLRLSIAAPERFYADTEAKFRLADALKKAGDRDGFLSVVRPLAVSGEPEVRRRALSLVQ